MTTLDAIILGIIQGVTEFFPISSSGHLVIFENILTSGYDQFFYFSVFVHLATFFAVLIYFRKIVIDLIVGLFKKQKESWQLLIGLAVATLPAVLVALTVSDYIDSVFSTAKPVLVAMFFTGIFFLVAEHFSKKIKLEAKNPSILKALLIGVVQGLAIIPGVSRSGSTLSAGLLLGLTREKAAEYSFLMALPAIFGASVFALGDGLQSEVTINWSVYIAGFIASFISGYFAISFLMHLYKKHSLAWFAVYLICISVGYFVVTNF